MAPVRSYTNWNSRTTYEKSQTKEYEYKKEKKGYENRKSKLSEWIKAFVTNQIVQMIFVIIISLFLLFFPVDFINYKII